MARILIAGLGKGFENRPQIKERTLMDFVFNKGENKNKEEVKEYDYRVANYKIKKENSDEYEIYRDEYFVTSAIEKHYNINKTIYIGTSGSMWDKLFVHYCEKNDISIENEENQKFIKELKEITKKANKNTEISKIDVEKFNDIFKNCEKKVEILVTKYGMNENEIFENFNSIMEIINRLEKEDEIYLDITHSFRSNAMWIFLVMNYITDVVDKNIKIKMITYGMLEELDVVENEFDEEGKPLKVATVINLKSFYDLMKWIKGANAFKEYGNSYEFLDMIENKKLKDSMKEFSDSMNLNYIGNIKENINEIKKNKENLEKLDGPSKLLLPGILNDFVDTFGKNEEVYWTMLKLANWHYNQKRYSMAYVNIVEAIYNFAGKYLKIEDINKNKENLRNNFILQINKENKHQFKNVNEEEIENKIKLGEIFEEARVVRNTISHTLENKEEMLKVISNIEKSITQLKELFKFKYTEEIIIEEKDLREQITYDYLEKECKNKNFKGVAILITNGIYDFLFEVLNVEKNNQNKNIVKNWLDNKTDNFIDKEERRELSKLMNFFAQVKNGNRAAIKEEVKKQIEILKNIMTNEKFVGNCKKIKLNNEKKSEKIKENILNGTKKELIRSSQNKIKYSIMVIGYSKLIEERKKELINKYKITNIKYIPEKYEEIWKNIGVDNQKEESIKNLKKLIKDNLELDDYVLIQGNDLGTTFKMVNWLKEQGFTPVYECERKNVEEILEDNKIKRIIKKEDLRYEKY